MKRKQTALPPQTDLPKPNLDARWKDIIKDLHVQFMWYFMPYLAEEIDFSKGVRFLDKELQRLLPDWHKKGALTGDVLMEYYLKSGKRQLVLVHVEVQHDGKKQFKRRMFYTFSRITDHFPTREFAALAIYTGEEAPPEPSVYRYRFHKTRLDYEFDAYLVREQNAEELLLSKNPFALVVLACLRVIQQRKKHKNDFEWLVAQKKALVRLCFEQGYSKLEIEKLLIFVSFTIALPKPEESEYDSFVLNILNIEAMSTITREENPIVFDMFVKLGLGGKTVEEFKSEVHQEAEARAEAMAQTMAEAMAQTMAQTMAEAQALEMANQIYAKYAQEMVIKLRESILKMHRAGISVDLIANINDCEVAFVESVIQESEQKS